MPFSVNDLQDLLRLLEQHPEWRAHLRAVLLGDEVLTLPQIVRELGQEIRRLVEAHRRAEERLARLEEAQIRAEERLTRLEEAQIRTEERLRRLEEAVAQLVEVQRRFEERLERVEARLERVEVRLDRVEDRLGRLEAVIGPTVEAEAEGILRMVLQDKGYRMLTEPVSLALNGEVDVAVRVVDPAGRELTAVVEAKARQSWRAVEAWASRMRSEGFQRRLAAVGFPGPYLVYAYGIRVDASAERAAQQFGIGLLSGQGERVVPEELLGSSP
ncbi:MAG: hypothetical protein QN193_10490 [Armatimonadota bacterium]|nr:hypothetical protein [Armatimonadota bacterium]MDR7571024.1 hypothetical protein [Armatimonadota bacterium]MDR7614442.1 hypothetical protein [Armatimonadota bacterium]